MYHPTTRVLTILELLQAYPQLSGAELARRLEVSQRSIRRYVLMLQDLGVPIETTRGSQGGYCLRPGFKLPPLMLTDDEALAIMLSLCAARRRGAGEATAVEGALAKIERVLPIALRERLQSLQSVATSAAMSQTPQPDGGILLTIGAAIARFHGVRLCYRADDGVETERSVDPYGLVCHWDRWYTVGWCGLRRDLRIFRLDRVMAATLEERAFVCPAGFDTLGYVLDALAMTPRRWSIDVLLETTLEEAQARILPGIAVLEPAAVGVALHSQAECLDRAAQELLALGYPFIIRQPPELRDAVRRLAAMAMAAAP